MIVVIAATEHEIVRCRSLLSDRDAIFSFVVSGIGATNCALATSRAISDLSPTLIVQVGIAGAFSRDLKLGEALFVVEDFQADLGAWRADSGRFEPMATPRFRVDNPTELRSVTSQSVNTACVGGLPDMGAMIESMEGAAFFQAASSVDGLRFAQIRTVSNYVDMPRSQWQIGLALEAIPDALVSVLKSFEMR